MHNYTKIFFPELPQEFILQIMKANIRDSIDKAYTAQFDNHGKIHSFINYTNLFSSFETFKLLIYVLFTEYDSLPKESSG
jgi:hypothetical protein